MATTTQPANALIGHEGEFRLPGGRTVYEGVCWDSATARGDRPRLARVVTVTEDGRHYLHQVNRWVDWDQPIEVLVDYDADDAYGPGDDCASCGVPAAECGHVRSEAS